MEIQRYLNALADWGSRWKLLPSPAKTEAMIFSQPNSPNRKRQVDLYLYGQKIRTVKEVRFLGALYDQGLTWSNHIDKLVQKATPRSIQICRLAKTFSRNEHRLVGQLINALIISLFDYSSVAWITAADSQWSKINQSQLRTLKVLLRVPRRTSNEAVLNRVNTGTYREIISNRAAKRFVNINKANNNLVKFQSRCVESNRDHRQRSPFEVLTEMADLDDILNETKCVTCTYSHDTPFFRLNKPNIIRLCPIHRSQQA